MNRKGCFLPSLLLAATTVASAAQESNHNLPTTSSDVRVPNVPAELAGAPAPSALPQSSLPPPPPPSEGIAPDPAPTNPGARDPVQLPFATAAADNCDTADCTPAGRGNAKSKATSAVHIGPPAQKALSDSRNWAENPSAMPTQDGSGRVLFMYSQSAPTIVCAPLHVCDIELQAGESVLGAPHVGDAVRWRISPALSGLDEKKVTHLIIKPTEAGLDTNLIVPTDRHTYHIRLVSSTSRYVSSVGFYYPEEQQQAWAEVAKANKTGGSNPGGDMPSVAVDRLNFNYRIKVIKGKPVFKPVRAMDDGYHTYISMNEDLPQLEAPVLVGLSPGGEEQIVNYRLKGNTYILDGTLTRLALISGVGRDQQRVELTRDPCRARGWLNICWDARE